MTKVIAARGMCAIASGRHSNRASDRGCWRQRQKMARSYLIPFLVSLCLTGCTGDAGLSTSSSNSVLQGAVKLGIPSGYCVDKASSREENDSATVLMGRCSDRASVKAALITLSVGQPGSAGVMVAGGADLAAFFTSEEGRAALSPKGKASQIQVIEALSVKDVFLMRVQEHGAPSYWRAILGLNGRLVSIAIKGGAGEELSPQNGRALIDRAIAAMRRANQG